MNWEEIEAIMEQALKNVLYEIKEDNSISAALDKAWNRGATSMMNETMLLILKRESDQIRKEA